MKQTLFAKMVKWGLIWIPVVLLLAWTSFEVAPKSGWGAVALAYFIPIAVLLWIGWIIRTSANKL